MGGGDLNQKKSWHPLRAANLNSVAKAEADAVAERKKVAARLEEIAEDRKREEIQRALIEAGGKPQAYDPKLAWMYQAPNAAGQDATGSEAYLLGKRRIDQLLQDNEAKKLQKLQSGADDALQKKAAVPPVRDMATKIRQDPLLQMKKVEQQAYEALMNDPIKRRQLLASMGMEDAEKAIGSASGSYGRLSTRFTMPCGLGGSKTVQRKLVLLGDGACGKTSLLNVFTRGYFPTVYEPTVFENYVHDIFVDNVHIELSLWDTAGQEEFDRLRSLSYDDTDLIMLCYSVDSKDSLENVESKWVGEIADNCPGVKLVLVALKCDLREGGDEDDAAAAAVGDTTNEDGNPREKGPTINYDQGLEVARRINALRYLECSAMRNRGVNEAFTEAARVALSVKKDREESRCTKLQPDFQPDVAHQQSRAVATWRMAVLLMPAPPTSLLVAQYSQGHVHLILGSNPVAATRTAQSLAAGAQPILVSASTSTSAVSRPELHPTLAAHIAAGRLRHLARPFAETDLLTLGRAQVGGVVDAVFVTSPRHPAAGAAAALCRRHRIPVNVVDCPALCTFALLSVHADGPLQVGVTTNGSGCRLASRIRRDMAAALPPGLGDACRRLGEVRRRVGLEDGRRTGRCRGRQDEGTDDDSVDQAATLNKLVTEADLDAAKTRRTRWLAQRCCDPTGPGHPDLLTRATLRALHAADLVLADKLVPAGVLDLVPRRTPVVIARKFPGNADRAQDELLARALAAVRAGQTVLRLKQGDPFVYGRGGEEVAFFRAAAGAALAGPADDDEDAAAAAAAWERAGGLVVLPGVTSALAAPLLAGVPPTQRDVADQVLVCTGTGKQGKAPAPPEFVPSRTVVFLMALHRIGGLVRELTTPVEAESPPSPPPPPASPGEESSGSTAAASPRRRLWPADTPCAVVERASCPDQRVIRTTLRFVAEAVEHAGSRPPGLLVVGGACEALYTPPPGGRAWVVEDGFRGLDWDDGAGEFTR
ncbi:hypothetical protein P8C59_009473 [Phyllachora maydis]|uniref:GTP-binding protein RHO3 n=1 Tax=Phyllachora maydis TaxID=1825666 RepID=A0AAD9IDB4_9PEZI|nr:hypothetical protein P8C59_009473 [Phyllachora maydis]